MKHSDGRILCENHISWGKMSKVDTTDYLSLDKKSK